MTKNWISVRQKWQSKIAQEEERLKTDSAPEENENFLERIGQGFDWYKRNVEEPWASVITAPFSPESPRQPFEGWLESERRQYQEWQAPRFVKGVAELSTPVNWIPFAGLGGKALKGVGLLPKATKVTQKTGKMAEEIADPDVADLFNVLKQAKVARKMTKQVRRIEQGQRIKKAADTFQEVYQKTGNINEARIAESRMLRGEYPTDVAQITEFLKPQTIESLRKKIADIPELSFWDSKRADLALVEFLENPDYLLQPNQIKTLNQIFKGGFEQLNAQKASLGSSGWTKFMDIAGIPRAVLASGDNSFPLRQGAILLARRPYLLPAVLAKSFKAIFNPKYSQQVDDVIRADPDFHLFEGLLGKTEGYIAPQPGKIALTIREETFQSNIAENLPVIGRLVRASERGFITGANYLRFKSFKKGLELGRKLGLTSDNDLDELRRFVNIASGRGEIPKTFTSSSPLLNALFFSPRLIMSRLQLPTTLFSSSKLVRREAWQTFIQFMGFGVGISSLAKLAGAEVEIDSKSSDFGKIKVENTRLDIWSGYAQWARFVSQLTTAERTTIAGEKQKLNRLDVVYRFMQSKGSPFASLMIDLLAGQNYIGQEMFEGGTETMKREAIARLVPLFAQDMLDAIKADGLAGGLTALPGGLGVGVVSYPPKQVAPPRIGESRRRLQGIKKGLSRRRLAGVR